MRTLGFILIYLKSVVLGLRKKDAFRLPERVRGTNYTEFAETVAAAYIRMTQGGIWSGSYNDANYYFIIHEIRMHRLIAKVWERTDLPECTSMSLRWQPNDTTLSFAMRVRTNYYTKSLSRTE